VADEQEATKAGPGSGPGPDPERARWRATTRANAVSRSPERQEHFLTTSGLEIQDLYAPSDVAGLDEDRDLGRPGEYPYTRGVQPTMYRGRLWTMRQYAGFSTAEDTNRRFRYLLEQGQTGLSVAFDLPTQMGYDSDAPQAEGEVGRVEVGFDPERLLVLGNGPVELSAIGQSRAEEDVGHVISRSASQGVRPQGLAAGPKRRLTPGTPHQKRQH